MTSELKHGAWWQRWDGDVPLGQIMEGRFVRLFAEAPAASRASESDLDALAKAMTADPEAEPTPEGTVDPEENPGITAAYTYFGQFIDHDLTLDPTSHLRERLSAEQLHKLVDFRTPRFDLDCLYGRGPSEQPYLFAPDGVRMQLGAAMSGNPRDPHSVDVPRGPNGRALIGDPRNDENRIVTQLQAAMLRFHNAMADAMPHASFEEVRDQVRWHYQWVVVNDFLPTVVGAHTIRAIFPHLAKGTSVTHDHPRLTIPVLARGLPLMPVEFSVAAYRFGHSMIRPIYRINESIARRQIFTSPENPAGDLGGMRPIPLDWAVDWQFFIDLDHGATPQSTGGGDDPIVRAPQHAYKIDTSLVSPLGKLPPSIAVNPSSLALRNLLRGETFSLPSGQAVAGHLGVPEIPADKLLIGKATTDPADKRPPIGEVAPALAAATPLWAYILAEAPVDSWKDATTDAERDAAPIRLGPVGGNLVGQTIAALLEGDPSSLLGDDASSFHPRAEFSHQGAFGLAELLNVALGRTP